MAVKKEMLALSLLITISGCATTEHSAVAGAMHYRIVVQYDQTIESAVRSGGYGWAHSEITSEYFPKTESGRQQLDLVIIPIARHEDVQSLVSGLRGRGYRPASLRELLAFGEQYPDVQKESALIGFGTAWDGGGWKARPQQESWPLHGRYPYLDYVGGNRLVDFYKMPAGRFGFGPDEFREFQGCFVEIQPTE